MLTYTTKNPSSSDKPDETRNGFTSAREEQQVSMWRYDFDHFLSSNREKILFDWRIDLSKKGNRGLRKIGEKNCVDKNLSLQRVVKF